MVTVIDMSTHNPIFHLNYRKGNINIHETDWKEIYEVIGPDHVIIILQRWSQMTITLEWDRKLWTSYFLHIHWGSLKAGRKKTMD